MPIVEWIDDGTDFGNASGLDYIALDVYETIAKRFGATVYHGKLPPDLEAEHEGRERPERDHPREPWAKLTISWDGGKVSGYSHDGNVSVSGYWTSYWLDQIDERTVVFDLRSVPSDRIVRLAVKGPMANPALPAGTVSTFGTMPSHMVGVADDYLRPYGGLAAVTGEDRG